jgi:hypothetical protein
MTQNKNVNGGPTMGGKMKAGAEKMGVSTGMHDTNTMETPGCNPPEHSPSSTSHSRNTYKGKSKY